MTRTTEKVNLDRAAMTMPPTPRTRLSPSILAMVDMRALRRSNCTCSAFNHKVVMLRMKDAAMAPPMQSLTATTPEAADRAATMASCQTWDLTQLQSAVVLVAKLSPTLPSTATAVANTSAQLRWLATTTSCDEQAA